MAVNQQPALWRPSNAPKPREGTDKRSEKQVEKSKKEKNRRDVERHHLERISRMFLREPQMQGWSKKALLTLGKISFLIDERDRFTYLICPSRCVLPVRP